MTTTSYDGRKPRGICYVCRREFSLNRAGRIGRHGELGVFPPRNCPGVGHLPWTKGGK